MDREKYTVCLLKALLYSPLFVSSCMGHACPRTSYMYTRFHSYEYLEIDTQCHINYMQEVDISATNLARM